MPAQASRAQDPSIANPAAWLSQHGWQPHVDNVADLFVAYGRAARGLITSSAASGPRRLATATLAKRLRECY